MEKIMKELKDKELKDMRFETDRAKVERIKRNRKAFEQSCNYDEDEV